MRYFAPKRVFSRQIAAYVPPWADAFSLTLTEGGQGVRISFRADGRQVVRRMGRERA
jgi:hypothetical protein